VARQIDAAMLRRNNMQLAKHRLERYF